MSSSRHDWPTDTAALPPPPPPPGPPPEADPGNRIGLGMLLAIVLLAAAAAGLAALLLTRHHGNSKTKASPTTVVVTTTAAPTTPAAAKTAKPAKKLILPVPDLVGSSWKDAAAGLRRAGFEVSLVSVSSALPRGTVAGQDPKPGAKVAKGSDIRLKLSTGAKASTTTPRATAAPTPTAPAATTTTAQQQTTTQAALQQTTSQTGRQPTTAQVPGFTGRQLQPAVQQLEQAGLKASIAYVPSDQPFGAVVAQTPSSGASAKTARR
jgi:serine/threonine-protein kinase